MPARSTSDPRVPEQHVMVVPLLVRSRLLPPEVPSLMGSDCICWLAAPAGWPMVTRALADLLGSACEIAFTFTVGGVGSVAGATYTPNVLMVPTLLLPPFTLLTCQVTVVFVVLMTVALNTCDDPGASVTALGDTLTEIIGGGVEPPPHPASSNAAQTVATHNPRLIGPPARRAHT